MITFTIVRLPKTDVGVAMPQYKIVDAIPILHP
jgi:hypothetical protein